MSIIQKNMRKEGGEMVFKPHLENIKATITSYTPIYELENYIPEFCSITWLEDIQDTDQFLKEKGMTRLDMVREMFSYRTLPTALETVRITFFLEGLDMTNVTHIIRHRMFSFSAQSTDPVSMENHDILTNAAYEKHPELQERAISLVTQLNDLYKDSIDAGINYYDARHYQPRAKEAKYFMSGNIKDFVAFINARLGRTNQPTSDNILALRMRQEILRVYPEVADILAKQMNPESVQRHYASSINSKMNMNTFPPDKLHAKYLKDNGIEIGKDVKFNHPKPKDEYETQEDFEKLFNNILEGKQ